MQVCSSGRTKLPLNTGNVRLCVLLEQDLQAVTLVKNMTDYLDTTRFSTGQASNLEGGSLLGFALHIRDRNRGECLLRLLYAVERSGVESRARGD